MKFYWELQFEDGSRLDRNAWRAQPREKRIDPQNIPSGHSPAVVVRLYETDSKAEVATVYVPPLAQPVCICRHAVNGLTGESLGDSYRIGWRIGKMRYLVALDPEMLAIDSFLDVID